MGGPILGLGPREASCPLVRERAKGGAGTCDAGTRLRAFLAALLLCSQRQVPQASTQCRTNMTGNAGQLSAQHQEAVGHGGCLKIKPCDGCSKVGPFLPERSKLPSVAKARIPLTPWKSVRLVNRLRPRVEER